METFGTWLRFISEELDNQDGTICRRIFTSLSARTWEANREKGHPGLVNRCVTHQRNLEPRTNAKWDVLMNGLVKEWAVGGDETKRDLARKCSNAATIISWM